MKPSIAPPIPTKAAIDDKASDLWCHASAFKDGEFIFFAILIVILYWYSFINMDIIDTDKGSNVGIDTSYKWNNDLLALYHIDKDTPTNISDNKNDTNVSAFSWP